MLINYVLMRLICRYDLETGASLTSDTWDYKPPSSQDIPEDMRTSFYDSGHNPAGVLSSKCTGEPSVMMGCGVMFAIRNALDSARKEAGFNAKDWFNMGKSQELKSFVLRLEPELKWGFLNEPKSRGSWRGFFKKCIFLLYFAQKEKLLTTFQKLFDPSIKMMTHGKN